MRYVFLSGSVLWASTVGAPVRGTINGKPLPVSTLSLS
jgi:hypothetical protein